MYCWTGGVTWRVDGECCNGGMTWCVLDLWCDMVCRWWVTQKWCVHCSTVRLFSRWCQVLISCANSCLLTLSFVKSWRSALCYLTIAVVYCMPSQYTLNYSEVISDIFHPQGQHIAPIEVTLYAIFCPHWCRSGEFCHWKWKYCNIITHRAYPLWDLSVKLLEFVHVALKV